MPWKEVKPMDEKILFIADYLRCQISFRELCGNYGISRKTGYKWIRRYEDAGIEALQERPRKPHNSPQRIPYRICKDVVAFRTKGRMQPGPKKIQMLLRGRYPQCDIPSRTTIYNILRREGLIDKRRLRKRVPPGVKPFGLVRQPNDLWSADFKGQFLTGNGKWCFPLTVMDHDSRYLLDCRALAGTGREVVKEVFEQIFKNYGLPQRIRTDNGVPFASQSIRGISHLSRWWIRLGILPERIEKGKPQQNSAHERMHRTLKDAALRPPARTHAHQQEVFDEVRKEYNEERPHESLNQQTPLSRYRPSPRPMPEKLPELLYPGHYRIVPVSTHGMAYCFGRYVYVGHVLTGERLGLEEVREGIWDAYFGAMRLGYIDLHEEKNNKYGYMQIKL